MEDTGAEAGAVRVDHRPVETHHLDQWRHLVRVSDPAVDLTQRVLQLGNLIFFMNYFFKTGGRGLDQPSWTRSGPR